MNAESPLERKFWRYWLSALLMLAMMIAMNPWFSNELSPWGISDHQTAATAMRVDAIQEAWQAAGVLGLVKLSMTIDFVYIAVYSFGAYCGGRLFTLTHKPGLRRLGRAILVSAIIMGAADYIETACQFYQLMTFKGNDTLAGIAAIAQPIKSIAFLVSFLGLPVALFLRRMARLAA